MREGGFGLLHGVVAKPNQHRLLRFLASALQDAAQLRQHLRPALDLDEQSPAFRNERQDLAQCRDLLRETVAFPFAPLAHVQPPQVSEGLCGDLVGNAGGAGGVTIMDDDDLAIRGQVDIQLVGIRLLLIAEFEGGEGVFRRIKRRAAMADDFNRIAHI